MSKVTSTRQVPSSRALRTLITIGATLSSIGLAAGGCKFWFWLFRPGLPRAYDERGLSFLQQPLFGWPVLILLILAGGILSAYAYKRLEYWYLWVGSGVIVDKDIVHYNQHGVRYKVYVEGLTRAGTVRVYGHNLTHGAYELQRIGERNSF